jgi:hypothetical protein
MHVGTTGVQDEDEARMILCEEQSFKHAKLMSKSCDNLVCYCKALPMLPPETQGKKRLVQI